MKQFSKLVVGLLLFLCGALMALPAFAQETIKIGLPMPLTGVLASVGKQVVAGAQLYIALHGDTVAGRKVQLIVRDDASVPDLSKRIAQEMIVNDKVGLVA
jgi:branched-chain amino acid transport system substrate-binding protein